MSSAFMRSRGKSETFDRLDGRLLNPVCPLLRAAVFFLSSELRSLAHVEADQFTDTTATLLKDDIHMYICIQTRLHMYRQRSLLCMQHSNDELVSSGRCRAAQKKKCSVGDGRMSAGSMEGRYVYGCVCMYVCTCMFMQEIRILLCTPL